MQTMTQVQLSVVVTIIGAINPTFVPMPGPFRAPVVIGTVFGTVHVDDPAWNGTMSVIGAEAAFFTMNASRELLALAQIDVPGSYNVTIMLSE